MDDPLKPPRPDVPAAAPPLAYTGERMVPESADALTYWEHVWRYRFACAYVRGKDVVDVACGEGYGTHGIRLAGARSVIGIDISAEAVEHARTAHGVDARVGSAEAIPLADRSADVVVSFETIEHVQDPARFVAECARLLRPDGTLIISTPNVSVYRGRTPENPYHCSEMSVEAFEALLRGTFCNIELFGQAWPVPWYLRRRGVGRLSRIVRRAFGSRSLAASRPRTARLCARRPVLLEPLFYPDSVRRGGPARLHESVYVVAVARDLR
jgi:SAM-dependent methyltransferase